MLHIILRRAKEDNERRVRRIWFDALSLKQELLELPEREAEQLENYLYAIELIISCKKAAIRVSEKVWNEFIEKVLTVEGIE
ncbi:MAG: NACHT C-terminal helical domain 2-containing protein [Prochlorotrichaceae cyanobacterium]